jgi:hypothetical protein
MGALARTLTEHIVTVSRKVATQQSPIVEATVLSRNPDGSLNVDDGRGGCARVIAAANVRVGDKVRVGTEPAIGSITSLPQDNFPVDAITIDCPTDDRPLCEEVIGVPCPPPVVSQLTGTGGGVDNRIGADWPNRAADFGLYAFNNWQLGPDGFYHNVGYTSQNGIYSARSQAASNFGSTTTYPPHTNTANKTYEIELARGFFEFANPIPVGQVAISGFLEFGVDSSSSYRSDDDCHIVVVPSLAPPFPLDHTFLPDVLFLELGRYRILDVVGHTGTAVYSVSIPLDFSDADVQEQLGFSTIRLAILTEYDFAGFLPPMPGLATFLAAGTPGFDRRNLLLSLYPSVVTVPPRLRVLTANV